jgi:pimeloyl-ACP methyl ester carboxylesterase
VNPRRVGLVLNAIETVSPRLCDEAVYWLFRWLAPRAKVTPRERSVHQSAVLGSIEVAGKRVVTYRWGDGKRPVLLVHGWQSRASCFAAFVQPLLDLGMSPVSFDAPANGDSQGRHTTILEYEAAIDQITASSDPFEGVIAHSFGALAVLDALRGRMERARVVTIAGISEFSFLHTAFCRELGLSPGAAMRLRSMVDTRLFPDISDAWSQFDAAREPDEIRGDLLVIHSRDDARVPVIHAERLSGAYPGRSRIEILDGLGHNRILRDTGVVMMAAEFLAAPPGASADGVASARDVVLDITRRVRAIRSDDGAARATPRGPQPNGSGAEGRPQPHVETRCHVD